MRVRSVAIAIALVGLTARAWAEDARIAAARVAFRDGDHERTVATLTPLLPALPDPERARALRLVGCAHMVLGDRAAAIRTFRASFALEPDAALEPELEASPDARGLFEIARGEWHNELIIAMQAHAQDIKRLALHVDIPAHPRGGRPIPIAIRVDDPGRLAARVELAYRRRGQPAFTLMTQRLIAATPVTFAIPADVTESARSFTLDYHVTVRHATGFDLRRDGDANRPHAVEVAAGHRPRWHESWWVRGALGLGVVGLGAGGYLFYRSIDVGGQHVVVPPP